MAALRDFIVERMEVSLRETFPIDRVRAASRYEENAVEDEPLRLLARVTALQTFVETGDGANLLAGYKRTANILKKETWDAGAAGTAEVEPAEAALADALAVAEPQAVAAIEAERFGDAMSALASLRAPIDAFFENVTVNATDAGIRARRLNLLARFRDAVHRVADFSKIEG